MLRRALALGHVLEPLERRVRDPQPRLGVRAALLGVAADARAAASSGASVSPGSTSVITTAP